MNLSLSIHFVMEMEEWVDFGKLIFLQVGSQSLLGYQLKVLKVIESYPQSATELMQKLNLKSRVGFRKTTYNQFCCWTNRYD